MSFADSALTTVSDLDILRASLGTNGAWEANIAASRIGRSKGYLVAAPRLRRCSSKRGCLHMVPPEDAILSEPYLTPAEIAHRWRLSVDSVVRLFEREAGILILENPTSKHRRRYRTIRIPISVLARVEKRLSLAGIKH